MTTKSPVLEEILTFRKAAKEDRISLVLSFQPANVYESDKMIYQTSKSTEQEDEKFGVADYDFFRYRSWHAMVY